MRMLLPIILAMLLMVVAPGSAAACSCAVPGLEESVREAEASLRDGLSLSARRDDYETCSLAARA